MRKWFGSTNSNRDCQKTNLIYMKDICASCNKAIDKGTRSDEFYYNLFGNFCRKCCERTGKNCMHHYQENVEVFNYAFQVDKNVENLKAWRKKGYLSHSHP